MPPATPISRSPARTAWSSEPDRAHARGADLVDRLRGDLLRDAALDLGLARGDLALAGLQHLAVDDALDLVGLDARRARAPPRSRCRRGRSRRATRARRPSSRTGCGRCRGSRSGTSAFGLSSRSVRCGSANASKHASILRGRGGHSTAPRPSSGADLVCVALFEGEELPAPFAEAPRRRATPRADPRRRRCFTPRPPRGCLSSGSASARTSSPSARVSPRRSRCARRRGSRRARSPGSLPPDGEDPQAHRRRARRGHDPRLLPLRPLPDAPRRTSAKPLESRSLELLSREAVWRRASRPRGSPPRPPTAPASCRTSPPTSPRPPSSPSAPPRSPSAHDGLTLEVLDRDDMERLEMGGLLAVSAGHRRAAEADRPALRGRRRRGDGGPGRQGRHLRLRRDLDQALRRHAGDEDGHVRRRRGARGRRRDRRAGAADRADRGRPLDREHAVGARGQARRHHHPATTARPSRSTTPTPRAG